MHSVNIKYVQHASLAQCQNRDLLPTTLCPTPNAILEGRYMQPESTASVHLHLSTPLPHPVELLMLLEKHHCRNRLRTQSDEAGHPTSKYPKESFLSVSLRQCLQDAHLPTSR